MLRPTFLPKLAAVFVEEYTYQHNKSTYGEPAPVFTFFTSTTTYANRTLQFAARKRADNGRDF